MTNLKMKIRQLLSEKHVMSGLTELFLVTDNQNISLTG